MGQVSPKNSAESRPAGEIREGKMPIKEEEVATKKGIMKYKEETIE